MPTPVVHWCSAVRRARPTGAIQRNNEDHGRNHGKVLEGVREAGHEDHVRQACAQLREEGRRGLLRELWRTGVRGITERGPQEMVQGQMGAFWSRRQDQGRLCQGIRPGRQAQMFTKIQSTRSGQERQEVRGT